MHWTDTHCHLNHPDLYAEWQATLFRAQRLGVSRLAIIGYDLESSQRAVELSEESDALYAVVGIHPHDALRCCSDVLCQLRALARNPRVVAIGEIGLDFYRNLAPRTAQYEAFHTQMRLAAELDLPVVIHCRDAYEELLQVLAEYPSVHGVLHCFSGTAEQAQQGLEMGYYLGIGGVVTFKSAETLRNITRSMPRDRLVLETDAPYLAPHPYRGKRNEPAYLPLIAQQVATLWEVSLETLSEQTEQNTDRLFRINR